MSAPEGERLPLGKVSSPYFLLAAPPLYFEIFRVYYLLSDAGGRTTRLDGDASDKRIRESSYSLDFVRGGSHRMTGVSIKRRRMTRW